MTCGIYKLNFVGTSKAYIGLSKNIEARIRGHRYALKNYSSNYKLIGAYTTYGIPTIEVICECDESELDYYEIEAIEIFNSINNGFNIREGGATGSTYSSGESNNMSKHTRDVYVSVFKHLCFNDDSYKYISELYDVSIQVVDHISSGVSHRGWLSIEFPEEYTLLTTKLNNRKYRKIELVHIDGRTFTANSLIEASNLLSIPASSISAVHTGQKLHAYGWGLKVPKVYIPTKKDVYTLKTSLVTIAFSNVYRFCIEQKITNRKAFTKFLKGAVPGDTFNEWTLA